METEGWDIRRAVEGLNTRTKMLDERFGCRFRRVSILELIRLESSAVVMR